MLQLPRALLTYAVFRTRFIRILPSSLYNNVRLNDAWRRHCVTTARRHWCKVQPHHHHHHHRAASSATRNTARSWARAMQSSHRSISSSERVYYVPHYRHALTVSRKRALAAFAICRGIRCRHFTKPKCHAEWTRRSMIRCQPQEFIHIIYDAVSQSDHPFSTRN